MSRCAVGEHNCLAAERTHFGAADVEHIGQAGHIGQRHIGALGGQTIAQTGTVHKQRHVVLMADSGQRFQLCLGVQGAVLSGVGDIHHAGLGKVLVAGIGPVSVVSIPHLLGGNFALHAGQGKALVAGGFHRAGFMYIDMPAVGTQHALPGF